MKRDDKDVASAPRGRSHAETPSPAALPSDPEFERFVDFARRIVSVPKAEIDEQERIYREERERRKESRPPPGEV